MSTYSFSAFASFGSIPAVLVVCSFVILDVRYIGLHTGLLLHRYVSVPSLVLDQALLACYVRERAHTYHDRLLDEGSK